MVEGSDTIMRGQESAGHGKDQLAKLSQVIQVRWIDAFARGRQHLILLWVLELLHQSCSHDSSRENRAASSIF